MTNKLVSIGKIPVTAMFCFAFLMSFFASINETNYTNRKISSLEIAKLDKSMDPPLDKLPDFVFIKNSQQSFSHENYYALYNGKLWIKPNSGTTGIRGEWKLFETTGVPFGQGAKSFAKDDEIVEFSQDGTMVVAVSNKSRFYIWQPTLKEHTEWQETLGTPFSGELLLPTNKSWGFSFSVAYAPYKRLTPMHDIVGYYDDIAGNKIEFGLTATIYTLDPDGQKIRYWDTGLPPSFHKAFATPDRGRFIAEKMSVAGSTVFVIDKTGRMFTKLYDYEVNGACPGLKFTYKPYRQTKNDKEILHLFDAVRSLPIPDWREQEKIPLTGKAAITNNITILINSVGNSGRQLRVQGLDNFGNHGFYYKQIFDKEWKFMITGEHFDESTILRDYGAEPVLGPRLDKNYSGDLSQSSSENLKVDLIDFYYYNSPAILRAHLGNKKIDLILHTVDAWSLNTQETENPETVGTSSGEPKLLLGTLEIPENILNSTDSETKQIIETYFARFNLVPFAFKIFADDDAISLKTRVIQRESPGYFDYKVRKPISLKLNRTDARFDLTTPVQKFTFMANDEKLKIDAAAIALSKKNDLDKIEKLIAANKAMLKHIKSINSKSKILRFFKGLLSTIAAGIYHVLNSIMTTLGVPSYYNLGGGLTMAGSTTFNMYAEMNMKLAFSNSRDFENSIRVLESRIGFLEAKRRELLTK